MAKPPEPRIDWTKVADNELARRLAERAEIESLRSIADNIGIARPSLLNIIYGQISTHPRLKTIELFAKYFEVPNWRIQAWIGVDVDLPGQGDFKAETLRLSQLVLERPDLAPLLEHLADLTPDEVRAARAFLESLNAQRPQHAAPSPKAEPPA